jgi:hypothetical protein
MEIFLEYSLKNYEILILCKISSPKMSVPSPRVIYNFPEVIQARLESVGERSPSVSNIPLTTSNTVQPSQPSQIFHKTVEKMVMKPSSNAPLIIMVTVSVILLIIFVILAIIAFSNIKDIDDKLVVNNLVTGICSTIGVTLSLFLFFYSLFHLFY